MLPSTLVLAGALLGGLLALSWFVHLETRDRREVIFGIILAVFLAEALLYRDQTQVPVGLARIPFAGGELRPQEILLPVAAFARLLVSSAPARLTATALAWIAFLGWYTTAGVMGLLAGNPTTEVLYQGKAAMTIGCAIFVVSGLRPERLVDRRLAGRWAIVLGVVSASWLLASITGRSAHLSLPLLPDMSIGALNVDAQLVLPVVGGVLLIVEACRQDRRTSVLVASTAMLFVPLAGDQGAAYVAVAAIAAAVFVASIGRTWSRRVAVTPTEALLMVGFLAGSLILTSIAEPENPPIDVAAQLDTTFLSPESQRTSDARLRLWSDAIHRIERNPVMGAGLGIRQPLRSQFEAEKETTAHNIFLDVAVRTGLVGLTMLLVALVLTMREGLTAWRGHHNALVAALSLGALVGITAFIANGSVESPLERFRNTTLLGMLAGLLIACARSARDTRRDRGHEWLEPTTLS